MRIQITLLLAVATAALPLAARATGGTSALAESRSVYFSATDAKGAPVTDLTAADIAVKEGGKDRQVVSVKPATSPMQIAVLVEDSGSGGFQPAVIQLFQSLLDRAQFSLRVLSPQALLVQDDTQDVEALKVALSKIGQRGKVQADPDQLIEAINEVSRTFQPRKAARPVIVAMTVAGDSSQTGNIDTVVDRLRDSRTMLNVLHLPNTPIGRLLGDGPKFSGGRSEVVGSSNGLAPAIGKIVDHLKTQYELVYSLPDGVKPNERVSVATSRKGVSIVAPTRLPEK